MKTFTFILLIIAANMHAQISDFKHINYTRADNIAELYKGESLKNIQLLTYNLTHSLKNDAEKFRAIYKWICSNIKGDYYLSKRIISKNKKLKDRPVASRQWQISMLPKMFKKLRNQKKTMCTGYAYLLQYMCKIASIECKIIHGYSRTPTTNMHTLDLINHSWNAVKLNDKWYLCDPTWSSGYINELYEFISDYNNGYFLTEPKLFSKNHYPINKKWLLYSNNSTSQFLESPVVYNETFKHDVFPISPAKLEIKTFTKQPTTFLFTCSDKQKNSFKLVIEKGSFIDIISPKINYNKKKNEIALLHYFRTKGTFKLHVLINNDIISTFYISTK
ncbi:transglutaminase domain-containing protein [Tenacibaculum sp. MAR_2009_124]|uniref:transglutaminase domain-containing protein n=1 Tax=Tenacibaculum sp. MAR_2009_124 TaxID=1250059 RepID=UPI0015A083EA|nr:transglutaminase domain-containing protein [Tenacibaculum sp. MAR_2009_124]